MRRYLVVAVALLGTATAATPPDSASGSESGSAATPDSRPSPVADDPGVVVAAWLAELPVDERVITEMAAFEKIDEVHASGLAETLRARIRTELAATLQDLAENGPTEFVEVSYGLGDPESEHDGVRDFVKSIIRTEAAAFYPAATMSPEDVLALWGSEEFRKRSSGRIVSIRMTDGLYCVETKGVGPFLNPMDSCAHLEELLLAQLCCQHSQVVTNDVEDGFQRVFFKESVKTILRLPDGLWVHYLNYSRTKGLGRISKRIGRGKVKGAQEELFEELRRELGGVE